MNEEFMRFTYEEAISIKLECEANEDYDLDLKEK